MAGMRKITLKEDVPAPLGGASKPYPRVGYDPGTRLHPCVMSNPSSPRVFKDFAALRAAAPTLAEGRPGADLFQTLDWFETLTRWGMDEDTQLQLLLFGDAAKPSCLPLLEQGRTLAACTNYYSSLFGPIGANGVARDPGAIADFLKTATPRWPLIDLRPLDADAAFTADLEHALRAAGYSTDRYFCFGNWYLPVAGRDYASYYASLSSRLRNTVERHRRKLQKAQPFDIAVHQAPGPQLEAAIAAFQTCYAASWKQPEPHPRFIPELCAMAARNGWLRLGVLRIDGEPAAAQLWLVKDGRALIFKLAYDARFTPFSPGSLLTAALMQHVIDTDHVQEIDYLTGDDAYKQDWMSHRRERIGLVAFKLSTPRGLLAAARHWGGKALRRLHAGYR